MEKLIVLIEDRQEEIQFDAANKLSDLRKILIDKKHISIDDDSQAWRFVEVTDGSTKTIDEPFEKYILVKSFLSNTNEIRITNIKRATEESIQLFAGALQEYIRFDVNKKLGDLRNFLVKKNHIEEEDDTHSWRFVSPTVTDPAGDISEAIIGRQTEIFTTVQDFLRGINKIRMTNIKRVKPDLIGVGVGHLAKGNIGLWVTSNSSGKFSPIMMTNVKATNPKKVSVFSNVVICEKGTELGFYIRNEAGKPFVYSILPQEGTPIVSKGFSVTEEIAMSMYQGSKKAIEIDSFKNLEIPSAQQVGHRRVTIKVWRFISYQNKYGSVINVDGGARATYMSSNVTYMSADPVPMSLSSNVDLVPGDSIEGGALREGRQTNGIMGKVYNAKSDPNDILGLFEIDFFVFKTKEDAQRTIESRVELIYS